MSSVVDVTSDDGFELSVTKDREGSGRAWRKLISTDAMGKTLVMIWKADRGTYVADNPAYSETFVVVAGTANVIVGDGAPVDIGPGSIVSMPLREGMKLKVITPYRMICTVVKESSR
jgi:mannose-6-phosphate isomerase-like protein (cupin superfamily)